MASHQVTWYMLIGTFMQRIHPKYLPWYQGMSHASNPFNELWGHLSKDEGYLSTELWTKESSRNENSDLRNGGKLHSRDCNLFQLKLQSCNMPNTHLILLG
jgi:hypothetical protein